MRPRLQYWHLKAGLTRESPISNRKLADPGDLRLLRLNESRVLRRASPRPYRKEANKSVTTWFSHQEPEVTARYYDQTELDFFAIVNDYLNQANWAAERYRSSLLSHRRWRFWVIIATGILTAINVCAALALLKKPFWGEISPAALLSVVAALYAAGLTVAGNVENFFNRVEEAAGFREMRDLLLNRYREYRSKWLYYVEAYGKTPAACVNAGQLYCQLVDSDQELRQKIKQLTEVRGPKGDKQSPGGQR
jgi:hypothetical protein